MASILYGPARGPDEPHSLTHLLGVLLLFLWFYATCWIFGRALGRGFSASCLEFPSEAFLGALGLALLAELLGLAGLLGFFPSPWMLGLLLVVGALSFLYCPIQKMGIGHSRAGIWHWLSGFLLVFFFVPLALRPDGMADPLIYHLTAPRWWMDEGRIWLPPEAMQIGAAGLWECLYLWGMHLTGGEAGLGLISGQVFAQLSHLLLAGISTYFLLKRFVRLSCPAADAEIVQAVTLVALLSSSQLGTVFLAKNDWAAGAAALLALLLLEQREVRPRLLAGLSLGCAVSIKPTVAFAMLPLLLVRLAKDRKGLFDVALIGLSATAAAAPWLWRNFEGTGNPFFPIGIFPLRPGAIGPTWEEAFRFYGGGGFSFVGKENLLKSVLIDQPLVWLAPCAIIVAWFLRRKVALPPGYLALCLGAIFFLGKIGALAEWRLFGFGIFLLGALPLANLLATLAGPAHRSLQRGLLWALFAALLAWSRPNWGAWQDLYRQPDFAYVLREHLGGGAAAWIRLNVKERGTVASVNEPRLYYLSDLRVSRLWDNAILDRELRGEMTISQALELLEKRGIRFLILSNLDWDITFNDRGVRFFESLARRFPQSVAYDGDFADVIDLLRIRKALNQQDAGE